MKKEKEQFVVWVVLFVFIYFFLCGNGKKRDNIYIYFVICSNQTSFDLQTSLKGTVFITNSSISKFSIQSVTVSTTRCLFLVDAGVVAEDQEVSNL